MGQAALVQLGLPRQSFDLEVVHHTPEEVQFSCMADGATAATGASVGKLNLKIAPATEADVATTYTNRATGVSVTLRPTARFRARFLNVPREGLVAAGQEVLRLTDEEIFEVVR
jgi:formylmethanofuran dehydrogenase subunit E